MVERVILRGVFGDAGQDCTLGQVQFLQVFSEIGSGSRIDAIGALAQIDEVEVHLQNAVFVPAQVLFQLQGAENFVELALDRIIVLIGQVFNQLLRDRRTAAFRAGDPVEHTLRSTAPVHALMFIKALILNSNKSILQVLWNFLQIGPDAVF